MLFYRFVLRFVRLYMVGGRIVVVGHWIYPSTSTDNDDDDDNDNNIITTAIVCIERHCVCTTLVNTRSDKWVRCVAVCELVVVVYRILLPSCCHVVYSVKLLLNINESTWMWVDCMRDQCEQLSVNFSIECCVCVCFDLNVISSSVNIQIHGQWVAAATNEIYKIRIILQISSTLSHYLGGVCVWSLFSVVGQQQ